MCLNALFKCFQVPVPVVWKSSLAYPLTQQRRAQRLPTYEIGTPDPD